jgi:hypothetical protein
MMASPRVPLGHIFFQEVVFIPPEYPGEQAAVELACRHFFGPL